MTVIIAIVALAAGFCWGVLLDWWDLRDNLKRAKARHPEQHAVLDELEHHLFGKEGT